MSLLPWPTLLTRPHEFADGPAADAWFTRIAHRLLNACRLVVAGKPHRLIEVEVYYHGPGHQDVFAHRDPVQVHPGQWYFHRTRGQYRGGSFKGLDLSFGGIVDGNAAHGGVLLRGLVDDSGMHIDGPSLLVDYLLSKAGHTSVAQLDAEIGTRLAWDPTSPVKLEDVPESEDRAILRTARVGLSLRRSRPGSPAVEFLLRPYRFLTEPRRTTKGKTHMVLTLLKRGETPERIREMTNTPMASIRRYLAEFETGKRELDANDYFDRELSKVDLCRLHGLLS